MNELLFNFVGPEPLNTATEKELMKFIKSVAVKSVHPEVYRQQFFRLKQSDGETITHYISRLKSQAMLCDFNQGCGCNASYSENMVTSQLIAGLYNQSHQSRILSEVGNLKTLQQLVDRLLTLKSTAQATSHFQPPQNDRTANITPIRSDYQRNKGHNRNNKSNTPQPNNQECKGCGREQHQRGRKQCPAQGRKCNKCGKMNHFANVCSSYATAAITEDADQLENDTFFISTVSTDQHL